MGILLLYKTTITIFLENTKDQSTPYWNEILRSQKYVDAYMKYAIECGKEESIVEGLRKTTGDNGYNNFTFLPLFMKITIASFL